MKNLLKQKNLLLIIVVLFWFSQYVYIPFQNPYLIICGASSNMIGTIIGAYGIAQCLLRLPVGLFADCIGKHKYFIFLGVLFGGLASCIRVVIPSSLGFLIANVFSGIASSMWISFMVHYTEFFSSENQQKATSTIILFNNLGMLLGFITSTIFYNVLGMQFLCIISSICGIVGAILALYIKDHVNECAGKLQIKKCILICKNRHLIFFSLLALIQQGIQMSTTMSFTNQILENIGASSLIIGFSSILYMVSAVLSARFASSKLCIQHGPKLWIPFVFFLLSIYCIFVPSISSIPVIFLFQIIPGLSTGILLSYLTTESMKYIPSCQKSTAMGLFQAVYAIGMSLFPIFTGKLISAFSIQYGYFILAIISFLGGVVCIIYYRLK